MEYGDCYTDGRSIGPAVRDNDFENTEDRS